jgi:hypothetical protein
MLSHGVKVNSIPFQFKKGSACVTAVLRLKGQIGVAVGFEGFGFDFEAGVFWDPVVYKACVAYQPSLPCEIGLTEDFYEDIGAYGRAVVDLDFAKLSVGPTAVSTYMTGPLPSQCFKTSAPHPLPTYGTTIKKLTTAHPPTHTEVHVVHTSPPEKHTTTTVEKHTTTKVEKHTTTKVEKHATTTERTHAATKPATSIKHSSSHSSHEPTHTATSHNSTVTGKKTETEKQTSSSTERHMKSHTTSHHKSHTETTSAREKNHSKSHTLSSHHSHSPTSVTHTHPQVTSPRLTTYTTSTTEIYTVTACMSLVEWCPYSLTSKITQTRTITDYTIICPATETGPDIPPSPIETIIAATGPASEPAVVITSSVEMTPIETPITSTVFYASPQPPITYTVTMSGTTSYPVANGPLPTWTPSQSSLYTTIAITSTKNGGIGPIIYSVGGFPTPEPPTTTAPPLPPSPVISLSSSNITIPGSSGLGTITASATPPPFIPTSDARSLCNSLVTIGVATTSLLFIFLIL